MSQPFASSFPFISPLRKVVFIKRIVLFASRNIETMVLLTKGVNSEFEEVMLNFSGFIEALSYFSHESCVVAPSERITEIGTFEFLYSRMYFGGSRLIPQLLHRLITSRWILAELIINEQHNREYGLDIKSNPTKFGVFLKSIFFGYVDEIIECVELMKSRGVLPRDLSRARLGSSKATLLHIALRFSFYALHIKSSDTAAATPGEPTMREKEIAARTKRIEDHDRRLLTYLMMTCKIHPFELTDANGFNAFHVAIRHHALKRPHLIRIMIELLPEEDRMQQLINQRITPEKYAAWTTRTPLGLLVREIARIAAPQQEQREQFVEGLRLLKSLGADPTIKMDFCFREYIDSPHSERSSSTRYQKVWRDVSPIEYVQELSEGSNAVIANGVEEFMLKWNEEINSMLVQSLKPGDFSAEAVEIADRIYNDVKDDGRRAPFLQTTITEHLFSVLAGFDGSEFEAGPVNGFLFYVSGSIYHICSHHDASRELLLVQSNAEILFKTMKADKTSDRGTASHCIVAIFHAIQLRPNDTALQQIYLADPRFVNGVVDFLDNCGIAENLDIICKELVDSLDPSITAHANFISSLRNHPRIIPALQSAVAVGGSNDDEEHVMEKFAQLILGKDVSKVKSFSKFEQEEQAKEEKEVEQTLSDKEVKR